MSLRAQHAQLLREVFEFHPGLCGDGFRIFLRVIVRGDYGIRAVPLHAFDKGFYVSRGWGNARFRFDIPDELKAEIMACEELISELHDLLEDYSPVWYTEEHHNRLASALGEPLVTPAIH